MEHSNQLQVDGLEDLVLIGRGGFSDVYRAYQPAFRRTVAIKVIRVPYLTTEVRMRFERECQALGLLSDHPHIVTVLEAGFTEHDDPFLVMNFVPGGSLEDRLARDPITWEEAVRTGVKIAGALAAAHDVGIIHRDVKPANVLMSAYGEPQLCDFGIARFDTSTTTAAGEVSASLAFAAPEVLSGDTPTAAVDVYSLAATIYTLIGGRPPFDMRDLTVPALIAAITSAPPPELDPSIAPQNVIASLTRALAKDPEHRQASMRVLAEELRDAQRANGETPTSYSHPRDHATLPVSSSPNDTAEIPVVRPPNTTAPASSSRQSEVEESSSVGPRSGRGLVAAFLGIVLALGAFVAIRAIAESDDAETSVTNDGAVQRTFQLTPSTLGCPAEPEQLSGQDLTGADLSGRDLRCADLTGTILVDANLQNAVLSNADLEGASLIGADLRQADLRRSHLLFSLLAGADLTEADLSEATVEPPSWRGTNLTRAVLFMVPLEQQDLSDAILDQTVCPDVTLSDDACTDHLTPNPPYEVFCPEGIIDPPPELRTGAVLTGVELRCLGLQDADLRFVTLLDVDLTGSDLTGANLAGASLTGVRLRHTTLVDTVFDDADLKEVTFGLGELDGLDLARAANLDGISLDYARGSGLDIGRWGASGLNLVGAELPGAQLDGLTVESLQHVDLRGASLRGVQLTGHVFDVSMRDADLTGATLHDVELGNVDLTGATMQDVTATSVVCNGVDPPSLDLCGQAG